MLIGYYCRHVRLGDKAIIHQILFLLHYYSEKKIIYATCLLMSCAEWKLYLQQSPNSYRYYLVVGCSFREIKKRNPRKYGIEF